MRAFAVLLILASASGAYAAGPCDALNSRQRAASAAGSESLPPLGEVRAAIVAAAQQAGRNDVSCDEVQSRGDREALQCYNGNEVALIGQTLSVVDGQPILVASLGETRRIIDKEGVLFDGKRRMPHMGGSPAGSVLRARQLFCESVVSGKTGMLVSPVSDTDPENRPKAVPAIYHPPAEDAAPRLYKT